MSLVCFERRVLRRAQLRIPTALRLADLLHIPHAHLHWHHSEWVRLHDGWLRRISQAIWIHSGRWSKQRVSFSLKVHLSIFVHIIKQIKMYIFYGSANRTILRMTLKPFTTLTHTQPILAGRSGKRWRAGICVFSIGWLLTSTNGFRTRLIAFWWQCWSRPFGMAFTPVTTFAFWAFRSICQSKMCTLSWCAKMQLGWSWL